MYTVTLFIDGQSKDIVVDDLLPCHPESGLPLFASSLTEGELWICILEKAWAKLHRSYCMIRLGSPSVVLYALTGGRPYTIYDHGILNA